MDFTSRHLPGIDCRLEELIFSFDWGATALGAVQTWPAYQKSCIRLLLDSDLPIVTLWGRDGVLIYNDAYAQFAGARHPGLLGAKVLEGWPEAADLNRRVLAAGFAGKTLSFRDEQLTLFRNGYPETIYLSLDYSPIRDEAGQPAGVFAVVQETTKRIQLEAQRASDTKQLNALHFRQLCLVELSDHLRRSETAGQIAAAVGKILGRLLGCARAGYAVINGNYTIIENDWTNGTATSLTGRHEFSALGHGYAARLHRGEILAVTDIRTHDATAESVECWPVIDVVAFLNVPLMENGVPVGILYAHEAQARHWTAEEVALVQDVADRTWEAIGRARAVDALRHMNQKLEEQVRERTAQRDRMWTLSTDLMMVTTIEEGRLLSVNPAWNSLLGWQESELIGASLYDFIFPEDIASTRIQREKLKKGQIIQKFENRYRTKSGDAVWLSWKAVPDGGIIHSVGRDITAEREQAEALQAAEEALRHAQKMEAVGQLTGGIAHDFNNLLQGILGPLELVQKRIAQGNLKALAAYTAQARQSAERAGALTHRLLAFSRRQPLAPKPVQANELIMAMEPLLRRTIGESILLEFDLAADLWPTHCDPHQLDSAILNLAINARDAMPDGGTLSLRSRNAPAGTDGHGTAGSPPDEDKICLSVIDTGTGMPPDVIAQAFDPFYTTKPLGQGTGLGLSMVYGFMRQSGGHAQITSKIACGTTINLYLPRHVTLSLHSPDGSEDATNPASYAALTTRTLGTVLVLEDETVVRDIVVEVLAELGLRILTAADGPAGLEILQSQESIDLLVTDIGLPGLNGRQVAEAARLRRPGLKILFMTGYAESAAMTKGFLQPGMHMITKPFGIDVFTTRIQAIIKSD